MAYVAISESLRDSVRRTINSKCDQEIHALKRPDPLTAQPNDQMFLESAWGEHLHLKAQIPPQWGKQVNEAQLATTAHDESGEAFRVVRQVTFTSPFIAPPKFTEYAWRVDVATDHPLIVPQVEYEIAARATRARWTKVKNDVHAFLSSCKSLNEALKLWPDLRVYIPSEALAKVEEKTAKAKAAESRAMEVLKQIDTDMAISSAVMVRMIEANSMATE